MIEEKEQEQEKEEEQVHDAHESQIFSLQCFSRLVLYRAGGSLINGHCGDGGRRETSGSSHSTPPPPPPPPLSPLPEVESALGFF